MNKVLVAILITLLLILIIDELVQRVVLPSFHPFPLSKRLNANFPFLEISSTWQTDPIPRIIHQTAPSDRSKWNPIWEKCQKTWIEKFPDYEYKLWTDDDLEEFIRTKYPWFYPTYMGYDKHIKRVDSARYFILYEYGGIYADMDYECLENFEETLPLGKVSIAEGKFINHPIFSEKYQNALMASPPKHPFWNCVIQTIFEHENVPHVLFATGPAVILASVKKSSHDMFQALSYGEYTNGEKWAKHYGTTSWVPNVLERNVQMTLYKTFT